MKIFVLFSLVAFFMPVAVHCRSNDLGGSVREHSGGDCPYQRPSANCQQGFFFAEHEPGCSDDEDCGESKKCCKHGCDMKCVTPVHYTRWCKAPVDLGILFEKQVNNWNAVKKMLNKVIHGMPISRDGIHISFRTIGEDSELLFKFKKLTGGKMKGVNVWSFIKNPPPQTGSLSTALQLAKGMFDEANGGRADAIKVLLVITDANVDEDEGTLAESAAQDLKDSGIIVQTVGISDDMSLANLVALATSDIYVWPDVGDELLANLRKLGKEPCRQ